MENIDSDLIRGNIDTIILKTMLDGDKYGLDIIKEVEQRSNGTYELKQPTLYSCLKRLENQELISSYWLDSDIGGRRHYYKLTDKGREQLTKKQEEWSRSKFIIDNLLSNYSYDDYRLVSKEDYERIIEGKQFVYEKQPEENESQSRSETEHVVEQKIEQSQAPEVQEDEPAEDNEVSQSEQIEPETESRIYISEKLERPVVSEPAPQPEPAEDLRSFENNILASLRKQDEQEINTYYGDQNYYVNGLKTEEIQTPPEPEYDVVQGNLFNTHTAASQSELDSKLNEFSESVNELSKFLARKNEPVEAHEETTESVPEYVEPENLDDAENIEYNEKPITQNYQTNVYASDTIDSFEDDFLDELSELSSTVNNGYFSSIDSADYDSSKVAEAYNSTYDYESQNSEQESVSIEEHFPTIDSFEDEDISSEDSSFESDNEYNDYNETTNDFSHFDSIISQNVNDYTVQSTMFNDNSLDIFQTKTNETQTSLPDQTSMPIETKKNVKDLISLRQEFEKEGIEIKEFKKYYKSEEAEKSYLLVNKINLINSLILLFGFMFILSAIYVVVSNTAYGKTFDLNFKYFLIGFIPFVVYALTYAILYLMNPYRKVSAKYAPRIMLFISVIITVQLLLITYCVNLQLGFYSFTQANYNHLIWIIPSIISFAPVVNTLSYMALYYSKNFNV